VPGEAAAYEGNRIPLRRIRPPPADGTPPAVSLAFTPGEPPSAAHPEGTVYVVLLGDDDAYHVTQWDLATRVALHQTTIDPRGANLAILFAGPAVRIMSAMYNGDLTFLQLTDSLKLVATHHLGQVSVRGPKAFAGDETLTVILADGTPDDTGSNRDPSGLFAMSFDAAGTRVAKRILVPKGRQAAMMGRNLAVVQGHVYVVLVDASDQLRAVQLTRELRTEREKPIAVPAAYANVESHLLNVDGHLVLDVPDQPDWLELSLDLSTVTHRPRPAPVPAFPGDDHCGVATRTASQLLALCDCGKFTCLAWAPLPTSPAPAASVRSP
jgi:hypothetical protein